MPDLDILIEQGLVMTMDPQRKIVTDGAVAIKGNQIVEIGRTEDLKGKYPNPKRVIGAKNKLVMPGLINTHVHLNIQAPKGIRPGNYGYGYPFLQRFHDIIASPYWTAELEYVQSAVSCIEMIKNGTTSIVDLGTPVGLEEMEVELIKESGLRAVLSPETMDIFEGPGYYIEQDKRKSLGSTQDNIDRVEQFIKKHHKSAGGRINIWPSIWTMVTTSDDLVKGLKKLADKYDVGMEVHASFMRDMTEKTVQLWGKGDAERLADLGALDHRTLIAHGGNLNGREVGLIRDAQASICHVIFSSMILAYGAAIWGRFPQWHKMGINISLGSDDQCVCNHMDVFRVMNATYLVHKEIQFNNNLWPPQAILEMATLNGAKSMLMEREIGSLEAGKKADIILIDLMRPEWVPWHRYNLIENLVLSATGDSVDTTIVDGQILMEGRQIKTLNERKLLEEEQSRVGELVESLSFCSPERPYPENMPPLW